MSNLYKRALEAISAIKSRLGLSASRRSRAQRAQEALANYSDHDQIQKDLERYNRTGRMTSRLRRFLRNLRHASDRDYLTEYDRRGGTPPATIDHDDKTLIEKALGQLGPLGQVLQNLWTGQTEPANADQVRAAAELLKAYGDTDSNYIDPAGIEAALDALDRSDIPVDIQRDDAAQLLEDIRAIEELGASVVDPEGSTIPISQRATTLGETGLSEIHLTPNSSNVYSFQYDFENSTLYVRFKAPQVSSGVRNVRGKGGMVGIRGKAGKTIIGRTDKPGPLYAYYDVPTRIYRRIIARSSAGKAVWDELRVRGSIWGHQYRYSLVQGALVQGEGGKLATYVPRRATRKGYKQRAVTEVGTGRRNYVRSSIDTRPNRGNRGNRGGA